MNYVIEILGPLLEGTAVTLQVFLITLVLAVPLGDLAWVVLIRWQKGQPFYVGDTNHLSHRLVRTGLSKTTAVMLIWLLALLIGTTALLLAVR